MDYYKEQLDQLREKMARKRKLSTEVAALEDQRSGLAARVQQLKEETYKEQLDVDQLENFSAAKLFYQIMGKLDERLEKEQAELYAAALRYDSARQELHAVEADLAARREELSLLGNCEAEYNRLLEARAGAAPGPPVPYGPPPPGIGGAAGPTGRPQQGTAGGYPGGL